MNIQLIDNKQIELSIILPAYNEAARISPTIEAITNFLQREQIKGEIIVVDDGSSDNTAKVVAAYQNDNNNLAVISYHKNQGKGFALKTGVSKSRGELVLITDADNSTPIEEYNKLKKELANNDCAIAIGSRYLQKESIKIKQPFYRIWLGRVGNIMIQTLILPGIVDTQCGFKLFRGNIAREIFTRLNIFRWGFDMEVLAIAHQKGYQIKEVPVNWFNTTNSRLRPIRDSLTTLRDLFKIKYSLLTNKYK